MAKSTPYLVEADGYGYSPEHAIDGTDDIFHPLDYDPNQWLQIDITEARIIQGLSVQSRDGFFIRLRGIEFRMGLEPVLHTNLQVGVSAGQK